MVNARLCETTRLVFFFASPRLFDFLNCETETSKYFKWERETFAFLLVIVACLGFLISLDFSLLASFCELAKTGNSL